MFEKHILGFSFSTEYEIYNLNSGLSILLRRDFRLYV